MKNEFLNRIDKLTPAIQPKYHQMKVHQMVCRFTDYYRWVLGEIQLKEKNLLNTQEFILLAQSKKTNPSSKGLDQVASNRTSSENFKKYIISLKKYLKVFSSIDEEHHCYPPPFYFRKIVNYYLRQFMV